MPFITGQSKATIPDEGTAGADDEVENGADDEDDEEVDEVLVKDREGDDMDVDVKVGVEKKVDCDCNAGKAVEEGTLGLDNDLLEYFDLMSGMSGLHNYRSGDFADAFTPPLTAPAMTQIKITTIKIQNVVFRTPHNVRRVCATGPIEAGFVNSSKEPTTSGGSWSTTCKPSCDVRRPSGGTTSKPS